MARIFRVSLERAARRAHHRSLPRTACAPAQAAGRHFREPETKYLAIERLLIGGSGDLFSGIALVAIRCSAPGDAHA